MYLKINTKIVKLGGSGFYISAGDTCHCTSVSVGQSVFLVLGYVCSEQPVFGNTGVVRELSFSRLECGVHDKLHISSAD